MRLPARLPRYYMPLLLFDAASLCYAVFRVMPAVLPLLFFVDAAPLRA